MRRLLLLIALSSACSKPKAAPPDAGRPDAAPAPKVVLVEELTLARGVWPADAPAPDEAKLKDRVLGELELSNLFVTSLETGRGKRARATLTYGVATEGEVARAYVSLTIKWPGDFEEPSLVEAVACDGKPAEAPALVECAVSRAVKGIIDREEVRRGDVAAVLEALERDDDQLRAAAVTAIAEHQIRAAVPKLLVMLDASDERVRDAAIGALAALKEKSAVAPLTKLAPFDDLDTMRRIIDAVGAIGGDEARAWLELVATGHGDPGIRKMAEQALTPRPSPRPSPR